MNPCGIQIKLSTLTHVNNVPWILTPKCLFMQNLHHWWARCMILLWDKITQSCSLTFLNFVCFISLQTYPWQRYCDAQIQNGHLHCSSCSTQLNPKKKEYAIPHLSSSCKNLILSQNHLDFLVQTRHIIPIFLHNHLKVLVNQCPPLSMEHKPTIQWYLINLLRFTKIWISIYALPTAIVTNTSNYFKQAQVCCVYAGAWGCIL